MANIKPNLDLSHFDSGYEVEQKDITREKPKNLQHLASGLNKPEGNIMSPKRKSRLPPPPPSDKRKKPQRRSSAKAKRLLYKRTGNPRVFLGGKRKRRRKTRKNKKRKSRKKSRKRKTKRRS